MPLRKVGGYWRWGWHGKLYKSRRKALQQGRAIEASKSRRRRKR